MQHVQGCLCMVVLFQGVACNLYIGCLSFFIFFKALHSDCKMQVVSAVSLFQHVHGVNDFSSDMCIKGKLPVVLNYSYIRLSGSDVTICFRLSLCDGQHIFCLW